LIYHKIKFEVKIKRFLNKTEITKNYLHLLIINMFFIQKLVTTIISSSSGMSCGSSVSKIPAEFSLNSISHQLTRAYIKIILKNHARSIIGETRHTSWHAPSRRRWPSRTSKVLLCMWNVVDCHDIRLWNGLEAYA